MSPWVSGGLDQPIADEERRTLLAIVIALLITITLLLTLTKPTAHHPNQHQPAAVAPLNTNHPAAQQRAVKVARGFLSSYLPYLYGHAPASQVRDLAGVLAGRLAVYTPRVSPAMRALHPRLIALHAGPATAGPILEVTASVNDGGLVYQLRVLLRWEAGRLLVSGLQGAR